MRHFSAAENLKHLMAYHTLEYDLLWNVPGWILINLLPRITA